MHRTASSITPRVSNYTTGTSAEKSSAFTDAAGYSQASAVIYHLIETAMENGLNPYRYLLWLSENAP